MLDGLDDYQSVTGADVDEDHPHGDLDRIELEGCPIMTNREEMQALYGADIVFLYECLHVRLALLDNPYGNSPRLTDYSHEFTRKLSHSQVAGLLSGFYHLQYDRFLYRDAPLAVYKDHDEPGYTSIASMLRSEGITMSSRDDVPYPPPSPYSSPWSSPGNAPLRGDLVLGLLRDVDALSMTWVNFSPYSSSDTEYYPISRWMVFTGSADSSWDSWPTGNERCFYFHASYVQGEPGDSTNQYVGDATMQVPGSIGQISCPFPGKGLCQSVRPLVRLTVMHNTGYDDPPSFTKYAYVTLPVFTGGQANRMHFIYASLIQAAERAVRDLDIDDRADADRLPFSTSRIGVSTTVLVSDLAAMCIIDPKYWEIR